MTAIIQTLLGRQKPVQPRHKGLIDMIMTWTAVSRQRRKLSEMSDSQLDDIGISRSEALREAERAPWDAPTHWFRR